VLFATAPKYSGNSLETRIVPAGAQLPDPDAEPAEQTSDEARPVAVTDKGDVHPEDVKSDKVIADKTQPDKVHPEKKTP